MSEIPNVKDLRILFLLRMRNDLLGYFSKLFVEYGDIFQKYYRGKNHYFTRHPEHAEHVLLSNQDNYRKNAVLVDIFKPFIGDTALFTSNNLSQWEHDRKIHNAFFNNDLFLEFYAKTIAGKCQSLICNWNEKLKKNEHSISFRLEIDYLLTTIIKDTIFHQLDIDVEEIVGKVSELLDVVTEKIHSILPFKWIFPTKKRASYREAIDICRKNGIKALRSRLMKGKDYDDLIGSLLASYEIVHENSPNSEIIRNHIVFSSLVSFLNTSGAIAWTMMMIARHPEFEKRLVEEVRQVCNGNPPTYENFLQLNYMHAFINEVLRLYPPASILLRDAIADDEIKGFPIQAKSAVILSVFHAHRHPDYWQNPEKFDPERFLKKPWGQEYQFAYFPFGGGKRRCIAKNFVFMEMCLIVASIIQHFHLDLPTGEKIRIVNLMAIQIRPSFETMILEKQR